MARTGEVTRRIDTGDIEKGEPKNVHQLFVDFLAKFDELVAQCAIVSSIGQKPYSAERLTKMRSDIDGVERIFLQLTKKDAIKWKVCLQRNLYGDNPILHGAVYCVSNSAGREEWRRLLIKALELLHPGI